MLSSWACIKKIHINQAVNKRLTFCYWETELNNTEVELNKAKDKLKKIEDKLDNTLALLNEKKVAGTKHENMFLWRIDMFQRDFERSQKRRKRENRQWPILHQNRNRKFWLQVE